MLWSNPHNCNEMQCWDSGSQMFTPGSPCGCWLDMTKLYWNREKMFKSEGKLAYPNASLLCFDSFPPQLNHWTIIFPTNLCLMKNVWLHNNQLISMFPTGQPKQYTDTLLPDSLHIIYLQFLLLITILFVLFNIFLQVVIWRKPKLDGETRIAVFH